MAGVRFADLQSRPTEFLDFTSLTSTSFSSSSRLRGGVPGAYGGVAPDGKPHGPRFSVYQNCPLPTPEERLLFILAYVKTLPSGGPGTPFGMGQSKANQWLHVLLHVLLATCVPLVMPGPRPERPGPATGVSTADTATVGGALEEEPTPIGGAPSPCHRPLLPMTGRNGASSAPKTLLNGKQSYSGKKSDHTVKMSCSSMPPHDPLSERHPRRPHPVIAHCRRDAVSFARRESALQDLGFLAFTLPQVEILMPMKKPRGQALTLGQHLRTRPCTTVGSGLSMSSSRRCRVVKDRIRLWKKVSAIW
jgi:hypothetical protein